MGMNAKLMVLQPGAMTTVQDLGRYGFQSIGVPTSGAMDQYALRMGNRLLGNPDNCAALECTVVGPRLAVLADTWVAITGADMGAALNHQPIPRWQAFQIQAGDLLTLGQIQSGCRAYICIAGGIDVPAVMGSCSTYLIGKFGGYNGRPLTKGDFIQTLPLSSADHFCAAAEATPVAYPSEVTLRAISGPQWDRFKQSRDCFFSSAYQVSDKADRMGYRLTGAAIKIDPGKNQTIVSEPVMPGSIQIPPDGQPIVLMREQTVGGYAKIATIISCDTDKIAQAIPGDTIYFKKVDPDEAVQALRRQKHQMLPSQ